MAAQQREAARILTAGRAMRLRSWLTSQAQTGDTYQEIADRIDWGPAEQATTSSRDSRQTPSSATAATRSQRRQTCEPS